MTNCNALIWNLKCRNLIITTNYLNCFKVVTTLLQGGKLTNLWCFQACSYLVMQASNFHMGAYVCTWKLTLYRIYIDYVCTYIRIRIHMVCTRMYISRYICKFIKIYDRPWAVFVTEPAQINHVSPNYTRLYV